MIIDFIHVIHWFSIFLIKVLRAQFRSSSEDRIKEQQAQNITLEFLASAISK